jgi:hypothetical protein
MDQEVERKIFTPELKLDTSGEGTFKAVFATMNVVDKDGDITLPGAFGNQNVILSQYNHGSWGKGADALPIGIGQIYEEGENAIIAGEFDMNDPAAVKTYQKMKYLTEKGRKQEFSYALPEIDFEYREEGGNRVRVLKRIVVPEVSPVLMGAGENTRILDIKSKVKDDEEEKQEEEKGKTFAEQAAETLESVKALVKRFQEIAELRKIAGTAVSPKSTDSLLRIRDSLQGIMKALDEISKTADEKMSDYLLLKKLSEENKEN